MDQKALRRSVKVIKRGDLEAAQDKSAQERRLELILRQTRNLAQRVEYELTEVRRNGKNKMD